MHQSRILQDGLYELHEKFMGGKSDGFVATGVIEIVYETDSTNSDRQ